jgi:predicted nucleotidyltransferase
MKKDLDHLPPRKQRELARIVEILHEEFEEALAGASSEKRRRGRILKIVLFGSYARGDWVDGFSSNRGYQSDYDILIVVNQKKLTDEAAIWYKAEDRVMRLTKAPFTLIVHTLDEINDQMAKGHYFFADIRREGVMLCELPGQKPLAKPRPLTPQAAYEISKEYFDDRHPRSTEAIAGYQFFLARQNLNDAAFLLHQAVERTYITFLLTLTHYTPNSHNIKLLRGLTESRDQRLIEAWPRHYKRDRSAYNILKRAYVEARYSPHFTITTEQLNWLEAGTKRLHDLVDQACQDHLAKLKAEIAG